MCQLKGSNAIIGICLFLFATMSGYQVYQQHMHVKIHDNISAFLDNITEKTTTVNVNEESTDSSSSSSYGLASKESLGFFNDISSHAWMRLKNRFQLT
mmetsp:Transcript_11047/g.13926  ORF Transcript_11047/g.13926 Transcript_11047/m.13926 type:complete len:98 (-) Transcript_11047:1090-1383(-)